MLSLCVFLAITSVSKGDRVCGWGGRQGCDAERRVLGPGDRGLEDPRLPPLRGQQARPSGQRSGETIYGRYGGYSNEYSSSELRVIWI